MDRRFFDGIPIREDSRIRKQGREGAFAASVRVALSDLSEGKIEFSESSPNTFVAKRENGDKFRITIEEV